MILQFIMLASIQEIKISAADDWNIHDLGARFVSILIIVKTLWLASLAGNWVKSDLIEMLKPQDSDVTVTRVRMRLFIAEAWAMNRNQFLRVAFV